MARKNNTKSTSFNPTPVTRLEKFLAAIAGLVNAPTPVTRKEYWMSKTAARIKAIEEGGGGGGATYTGEDGIIVNNTSHVISPDMDVLAAKSDLDDIAELIPASASITNLLATLADLGDVKIEKLASDSETAGYHYFKVTTPNLIYNIIFGRNIFNRVEFTQMGEYGDLCSNATVNIPLYPYSNQHSANFSEQVHITLLNAAWNANSASETLPNPTYFGARLVNDKLATVSGVKQMRCVLTCNRGTQSLPFPPNIRVYYLHINIKAI